MAKTKIITDIAIGLGIFTFGFMAYVLIESMAKYYKEIEIGKCTKEDE